MIDTLEKKADGAAYSANEARDKNRDEYNDTADEYTIWADNNILMQ